MRAAPPDEDDRASNASSNRLRSPIPKGSTTSSARRLEELAEDGADDVRSDLQEGSEAARTIPVHTTGVVSDVPSLLNAHVTAHLHIARARTWSERPPWPPLRVLRVVVREFWTPPSS